MIFLNKLSKILETKIPSGLELQFLEMNMTYIFQEQMIGIKE